LVLQLATVHTLAPLEVSKPPTRLSMLVETPSLEQKQPQTFTAELADVWPSAASTSRRTVGEFIWRRRLSASRYEAPLGVMRGGDATLAN
jgi:hypothetical protein